MMNKSIQIATLLMIASASAAQQQVPDPEELPGTDTEYADKILDEIEGEAEAIISTSRGYTDEEAREYNSWALSYKKGAYVWHQTSTIIIFYVVVFVVLAGVLLAGWQLHAWIRRVKKYDETFIRLLERDVDVDRELVTTIGESSGGTVDLKSNALTVSSPYVGVVILGLSMGFFLAYLLLVYPVTSGP